VQFSSFSPSKYDFYFCSHEINVCLLSGTCNIVGFYTTVLLSWVRVRVFMFIFCYANRQVPSWVTLFLLFLFVSLNFCVCYRSTVKDLFIYYCSQIFRINDICVMNVRKYSVWSCPKCYGEKNRRAYLKIMSANVPVHFLWFMSTVNVVYMPLLFPFRNPTVCFRLHLRWNNECTGWPKKYATTNFFRNRIKDYQRD